MRKMKTRDVARCWVTEPNGDFTNHNHQFYSCAGVLYSYGSHYPAGRYVEFNGGMVFAINSERYSVTTSKHMGYLRGALSGLGVPVYEAPNATLPHEKAKLIHTGSGEWIR